MRRGRGGSILRSREDAFYAFFDLTACCCTCSAPARARESIQREEVVRRRSCFVATSAPETRPPEKQRLPLAKPLGSAGCRALEIPDVGE